MKIHEADGVFHGGGVKAIALVGALLAFDERGYRRWVSVAGTSGGALVAASLATGRDPRQTEELLRRAPLRRFADFGSGGERIGGPLNLLRRHGLAHGDYLRRWLDAELDSRTFADVRDGTDYRLKLIAADVTHRELLVLPEDLRRYRLPGRSEPIDPDRFPIADAVRMSMSVPYFFEPVELVHDGSGRTATIVDGGLVPSFPVWLFDVEGRDPERPTFGFRIAGGRPLGSRRREFLERVGWPIKLGLDMFRTATEAWDSRLVPASSRARTCLVPAGPVATTEFGLTQLQETELIEGGRRAARAFLDRFDLEAYANVYGRGLATAVSA
jgi:NTE family protein